MSRRLIGSIRNALGLAALSASLAAPALADTALVGIDSPSSSGVASRLFIVDRSNGAATTYLTLTGPASNASFTDVAQLGGTFYASDIRNPSGGFSLVSINATTGATAVLNNQGGDVDWHGLAANAPANLLYAVDSTSGNFRSYNVVTSTLTLVGNTGLTGNNGIDDLTYDGVNNLLYGISQDGEFYRIDTANGTPTFLGNTGLTTGDFRLYGLAYDAAVQTFYATGTQIGGASTLYSWTLATITSPAQIGSSGVNGLDGLTIAEVNVVPEPASLAMALIGLATVAGTTRLRRRLA